MTEPKHPDTLVLLSGVAFEEDIAWGTGDRATFATGTAEVRTVDSMQPKGFRHLPSY